MTHRDHVARTLRAIPARISRGLRVGLVGAVALTASLDAQVFTAEAPLRRDYTGPSVAPYAHENQVYNIFYPSGPMPPEGYPVVVMLEAGGFLSASVPSQITAITGFLHDALKADVAVVWASGTPARGGSTGNPVDGVPGDGLGPAYKGNGVFIPPTFDVGPGYTGGPLHPFHDPERPMSEKDLIMLVQHVKENAGTLGIDVDRIALHGRSSSAIVAWFIAAGPDRSDVWLNPSGQELQSTDVSAFVLRNGTTYWPVLAPTAPPTAYHFPIDPGPGGGLYDVPATNIQDAPPELLEQVSALVYSLDEPASPGIILDVHQRPIMLIGGGATLDQTSIAGPPYLQGHYTNPHTAWCAFAMKNKFGNMHFAVADLSASVGMPPIWDALFDSDAEAIDAEMLSWLQGIWADGGLVDPWIYDGDVGLAGTSGVAPVLRGTGDFAAGTDNSLELRWARPQSLTTLVVGFSDLSVPFKGGVLVPSPDILLNFPSDVGGTWILRFDLPNDTPAGLTLRMQAWVDDPEGAAGSGLAASNSLSVTTS